MTRIAISGTGFIGTGLAHALVNHVRFKVCSVLTRRDPKSVTHPLAETLTNSLTDCLEHCDILVECSGDVLHATNVIAAAHDKGIPVVTMNSEFHVTVGSAFVNTGYLTEAEGDQPGCLAALKQRVSSMGFRPVVYGNIKGFLNHLPDPDEMRHWAQRQGISLRQVTAFTDGTKVQIEQAFVANGLNSDILQDGLCGPVSADLTSAAHELAEKAEQQGYSSISDYVLNAGGPAGVFIVARHDTAQRGFLEYLKLGTGPHYFLLQPFHLCHLEIIRTLEAVADGAPPLLNNGAAPRVGIAAIAKRDLRAGSQLTHAIGSFDFRAEAVRFSSHQTLVPAGLLQNFTLRCDVRQGERLAWDHVDLPDSLALQVFKRIQEAHT